MQEGYAVALPPLHWGELLLHEGLEQAGLETTPRRITLELVKCESRCYRTPGLKSS